MDGMWLHLPHTVENFLVQISKAEFIECDYQGAQKYLRHNHQANSTMTQYGTQVLLQVTKVLDDLGIQFWLSCGTCLGEIFFKILRIRTFLHQVDNNQKVNTTSEAAAVSLAPPHFHMAEELLRNDRLVPLLAPSCTSLFI